MFAKREIKIFPLVLKDIEIEEECVSPNEIIPGLFLSSFKIARDINKLQELNIKGIINVTKDILNYHEDKGIKYCNIPINDSWTDNIIDYFDTTHKFIDEHLNRGENVLVHCFAGISRSATIVISYLMKKNKLNYKKAYKIVKTKRNKIEPNLSFIGQLFVYEKRII